MGIQKPQFSLQLIGAVLASVVAGQVASANDQASIPDTRAAAAIQEMISNGHLYFDPETGRIRIKSSVLSILESYGGVNVRTIPAEASRSCSATGGDYGF